jgi:uncharacterized UBP type Zn finger protein
MEKGKTINKNDCPHLSEIKVTKSDQEKCEQCEIKEDLRVCTSCGHVHCCEDGNAHDTDHYRKTTHPIIVPVHTDYKFMWCYQCNAYLK